MATVRALSPDGLFNFMAEPTRPVVLQVGDTRGHSIRGSIHVPEEWAGDQARWEELLLGLESDGRLDSCAPIIICSADASVGYRSAEAICSDAVADSVLSVTAVHLLQPGALEGLDPLLLGDGDPPNLPARVLVAPGILFLGDQDAAADLGILRALGVQSVLNATDDLPNLYEDELNYLRIPVSDVPEEDLVRHLERAVGFIATELDAGHGVLVHCSYGVSRSPSIVTAYLMRTCGWGYREALEKLRASRWSVRPNSGFQQQLERFEGRIMGTHHDTLRSLTAVEAS